MAASRRRKRALCSFLEMRETRQRSNHPPLVHATHIQRWPLIRSGLHSTNSNTIQHAATYNLSVVETAAHHACNSRVLSNGRHRHQQQPATQCGVGATLTEDAPDCQASTECCRRAGWCTRSSICTAYEQPSHHAARRRSRNKSARVRQRPLRPFTTTLTQTYLRMHTEASTLKQTHRRTTLSSPAAERGGMKHTRTQHTVKAPHALKICQIPQCPRDAAVELVGMQVQLPAEHISSHRITPCRVSSPLYHVSSPRVSHHVVIAILTDTGRKLTAV
jgi:hypothetical protein